MDGIRTASARGTITNAGTRTISCSVHLTFELFDAAGTRIALLTDTQPSPAAGGKYTIVPGYTQGTGVPVIGVPTVDIQLLKDNIGAILMPEGGWATAYVGLDMYSPISQADYLKTTKTQSPPETYSAPRVSWGFPAPTIVALESRDGILLDFAVVIGEKKKNYWPAILVWAGAAAFFLPRLFKKQRR